MFGSDWTGLGLERVGVASTPRVDRETDESLRKRLMYVAGHPKREPHIAARIEVARDGELDLLAEEHGIKRRGT